MQANDPHRFQVVGTLSQQEAFGLLRILFGCIWLLNVWFQSNSAYINHLFLQSFHAGIAGQPEWLARYTQAVIHAIQTIGPARVALATILIEGLLALSLLTGLWLPFFAWVGVGYNLFMWSTVGGLGGPYVQGSTDPGTAIVYALAFVFIILTRSWEQLSFAPQRFDIRMSGRHYDVGRILFGLLWTFDAFWKWHPYFLKHGVDNLVQSQQGQPAWIVSYIQFFIDVIYLVGPFTFGIVVAIVETLIAVSLLTKKGLDYLLPIGIFYSFILWTTAEGWGGPYGRGFTGNRGDIWGTAIIYCLIFLYLMVIYPPFGIWKPEPQNRVRPDP
ncbi:MAG: hypothetical protein ACYC6G_15945 [Desulfobaccales bacterium]